ncbi:Methylated-DNA--protein-cysteine methyltransferase [uncultured delta proteobacterium]|uniref:Methylated-DNA--protein-cysteine methyltransferase n=1 Tax=uncultured delta proteobacterium TaxID=34034 RepID=A0A212JBR1_9DELT|nr:Methylated-DNA--protein-cysteine methyltransferase [uncultured delta proteobacterium]
MLYTTGYDSPLGSITLASDGENLVGLWIEGQKYFAATVKEETVEKPGLPVFATVTAWLDAYFAGKKPDIASLPLAPAGGAFRKAVWDILCEIPYGHCTTYGEIAKKTAARLRKPSMSSQAVGGAVGHNPISIIIPCHRVVGSNGSLTGYAGGIDKKIHLLRLEGADMAGFFIPAKGTAL